MPEPGPDPAGINVPPGPHLHEPALPDEDTKISVVVTDRRKDEERIQLQARMLDAVGDAVIAVDTDHKIIYWNEAATRTYGWKPEEVIGHNTVEVTVPEISKEDAQKILAQLDKGEILVRGIPGASPGRPRISRSCNRLPPFR